jgi:hypothetical protein
MAVTPLVKTGVQEIWNALQRLDSGFRRNDVKKTKIDFFTSSPLGGGGLEGGEISPPANYLVIER